MCARQEIRNIRSPTVGHMKQMRASFAIEQFATRCVGIRPRGANPRIELTKYSVPENQNWPATVRRIANGSTGCNTRSITPVWHTAAGAVGAPTAGKHIANSESDLISEP